MTFGQGVLEAQDVRIHLLNLLPQQFLPLRPLGVKALRIAVVLVDPPAILALDRCPPVSPGVRESFFEVEIGDVSPSNDRML